MKAPALTYSSILSLLVWRRVRWIFGTLLLVAALLKWRAFGEGSVLSVVGPSVEWALIQVEIVAAIWLFSGWKSHASWGLCVLLFASFSGALLAMIFQERPSCGCLGAVEINPRSMLAAESAALGLLVLVGFVEHRLGNWEFQFTGFAQRLWPSTMAFALPLAAVLGFSVLYWNGPITVAYSRLLPMVLTGHALVTEPAIPKVEPGKVGEWRSLRFDVVNRGSEVVRLIGAEQGCKCRAVQSLPLDIPAGGRVTIAVDVKLGSKSSFWMLTSSQRQERLICHWYGATVDE